MLWDEFTFSSFKLVNHQSPLLIWSYLPKFLECHNALTTPQHNLNQTSDSPVFPRMFSNNRKSGRKIWISTGKSFAILRIGHCNQTGNERRHPVPPSSSIKPEVSVITWLQHVPKALVVPAWNWSAFIYIYSFLIFLPLPLFLSLLVGPNSSTVCGSVIMFAKYQRTPCWDEGGGEGVEDEL